MNTYSPCYDRLHMPKVSLLISFTYIYYASSLQLCIGFMLMYLSLCACVYSSPSWIPLIIRPCVATETVWKLKHLAEVIARHCMRVPNCRCLCTTEVGEGQGRGQFLCNSDKFQRPIKVTRQPYEI